MPDSSPLSEQTAIVTGASSGIGRAIAEKLGAAGAHVFLSGRTQAPMDDSAKTIEQAGGKATVVVGDVRDIEQVRGLVSGAVDATGRLDIMVNNAGLSYPAKILRSGARCSRRTSWRCWWAARRPFTRCGRARPRARS